MAPVLATLYPSPPRRVFGIASLIALGGALLWVAFAHPPEGLGWRLFLLGGGALALWLADAMRRATQRPLELTREELREKGGRMLARIEDVRSVERGVFAFKPSAGFMLKLNTPASRTWAPGLWWRFGRMVGVGGVTGGNEGKYMAEVIAAMIEERKQTLP